MAELAHPSPSDWRARKHEREAIGAHTSTSGLLEMLELYHQDPGCLDSVIQLLTQREDEAIPGLVGLARHPDPNVRTYSALALGRAHGLSSAASMQVGQALLAAVDDEDENVRQHAVEALGTRRYALAVPRLTTLLSGDFFLAFSAIEALGEIGEVSALPALEALAGDEMLGEAAGEASVRIRGTSASEADVFDEETSSLDDEGLKAMVYSLYDTDESGRLQHALPWLIHSSPRARLAAIDALLFHGGLSDETLVDLMTRPEARLREAAVRICARQGSSAILCGALDDADEDVRRCAAEALAGHPDGVEPLMRALSEDPSAHVRAAAARSLATVVAARGALTRALSDPAGWVRMQACRALAGFRDSADLEPLLSLQHDPLPYVRASLASALHAFARIPSASAALRSLELDPEPPVAAAAAASLA